MAEHLVEVAGGDLEGAEMVDDLLGEQEEKSKEKRAREIISHPTINPERGF